MSELIRKLLTGQPMSRREFLKGTGGAAAAAASNKLPVSNQAATGIPAYVPRKSPFLPGMVELFATGPGQDARMWLDGGEQSAVARYYGNTDAPDMTQQDYVRLIQEFNRARRALADAPQLPKAAPPPYKAGGQGAEREFGRLQWDAEQGKWEVVVDRYVKEANDSPYAGKRRPPDEDGYWDYEPDEYPVFQERVKWSEGMPLDGILDEDGEIGDPWEELHQAPSLEDIGRAYGLVKKQMTPDERAAQKAMDDAKARTLEQMRPAGGRAAQSPSLRSDAIQITGNMGLPGDDMTERMGRIRRLLGVAAPIAAAAAGGQRDE